jgi:hypothetical protein
MPDYTQNYILGRGELFFNRFMPDTTTGTGEHYFGNTPGFELSIEEEVLEHFSSERGLRVKDRSVTLQNDASGTLIVDNISAETISLFLAGTAGDGTGTNPNFMGISTVAQAAIAVAQTDTFTDVNLNRWYQLGLASSSVPLLARTYGIGVRNVIDVVVAVGADTLTVDTQYELDAGLGRLWLPSGDADLEAGDDVIVTWEADAATYSVVADGEQSVYGSMRFISYNAVGAQRNVFLPYVKLTPNGAIALKGDDWQQASMNIEVLKLNSSTPRIVTFS